MIKRLDWVDILKGMGMFAVVFGHSGFPPTVQWWIFSYHMPLFFFISGFLFQPHKYTSFKEFFTKKAKSLLVPYFYFAIIVAILSVFNEALPATDYFLKEILYGSSSALWFLPVLFLTEIMVYFIQKAKNKYAIGALLIVSVIVSYELFLLNFHLPYKAEVVFISAFFYGIGFLSADQIKERLSKINTILKAGLFIALLALNIFFCYKNITQVDLASNTMGNYFYGIASALCGTFAFLFLSDVIAVKPNIFNRVFTYIGRNTLVILGLHQILKIYLTIIFGMISYKGIVMTAARHMIFWILMVLLIEIINRYFPFLTGGRKKVTVSKAPAITNTTPL